MTFSASPIYTYGSQFAVGGVVGLLRGSLSNCFSTGTVSSSSNQSFTAGGVVGIISDGSLSNCYSTVIVSSSSSQSSTAGGVVGKNHGNVSKCYSTSTVSSFSYMTSSFAGGVVGYSSTSEGIVSVSDCYSTGSVNSSCEYSPFTSVSFAGGVVGYNDSGDNATAIVSNCYSTATVSSSCESSSLNTVSHAGGVVGCSSYGVNTSVSNCAALNPSISCTNNIYIDFGRIHGNIWKAIGTLSNNIAFKYMLNPDGYPSWDNKGASNFDGEDISYQAIFEDGTLGNRFTSTNGWTTQNGKLPGLFGNTVDIPEYLMQKFPVVILM